MAVADIFDTLIFKRIYKDAMPLEKAYAIIREESGTHFKPKIAEAFLAIVDDIIINEKIELRGMRDENAIYRKNWSFWGFLQLLELLLLSGV